jgi:tetratricopeptide (TPR) repeat protein
MSVNEHLVTHLLHDARYYSDHRMWLHAAQVYRRLADAHPGEIRFVLELATVYLDMGNPDAAEQVLLGALGGDRGNADILYALGIARRRAGDTERALSYLEQLIPRRLPKVHLAIGMIHHDRGDLISAERHLRLALELEPDFPGADLALAQVLLRMGHGARAVQVLRDIVAARPLDRDARYFLGLAHALEMQWTDALAEYHLALQTQPDDAPVLIAAAEVRMQLRQPDEAERLLLTALRAEPGSAPVFIALGRVALMRTHRDRAEDYFRRAVALDPDNAEAQTQLNLLSVHGIAPR